jgi:uncharacterized membrane protein
MTTKQKINLDQVLNEIEAHAEDEQDIWLDKILDKIEEIKAHQKLQREKYGVKLAPIPEGKKLNNVISIYR